MKEISKHTQIELLKTIGIKRLARNEVAKQMRVSEYTLRQVLDKETPVPVKNTTYLKVNDWLRENDFSSILYNM